MHQARRDLVLQTPFGKATTGTFALRSPVRPNPVFATALHRRSNGFCGGLNRGYPRGPSNSFAGARHYLKNLLLKIDSTGVHRYIYIDIAKERTHGYAASD